MDAVNSLRDWEKSILKEVHPDYEVSDDSDDDGRKEKAPESNSAAAETPADKKGAKK